MTLDAFRRLPYPDASEQKNAQVFCTGDAAIADNTEALEVALNFLPSAEKQIGVIRCGYFESKAELYRRAGMNADMVAKMTLASSPWMAAYISVGTTGSSNDVVYSFMRDPSDEIFKLYSIGVSADAGAAVHALAGLIEKFGRPTSQVADKVQNRMGASFDHMVAIWSNPSSEVRFESPTNQIDRMSLTYAETRLLGYVALMKAKIQGPDSNKM